MTSKSAARLTFEAIPFFEFLERAWEFVRRPEIKGETLADSQLLYAGHNFVKSLALALVVIALLQFAFPSQFDIDLSKAINPVYLAIVLAVQAVAFAIALSITSSVFLFPKTRRFHHLIVHQVIQAYAVANLFVVVMFVIGMNRILKVGDYSAAIDSADMKLGALVAGGALCLAWRTVLTPLWKYFANQFSKPVAFGVTVIALYVSSWPWSHGYAGYGFEELVLNRPVLCKQIYEDKKAKGALPSSLQEERLFVAICLRKREGPFGPH